MGKNYINGKTFLEKRFINKKYSRILPTIKLFFFPYNKRYNEDLEIEDAVHTAILTLKVRFISMYMYLYYSVYVCVYVYVYVCVCVCVCVFKGILFLLYVCVCVCIMLRAHKVRACNMHGRSIWAKFTASTIYGF